MGNLQSQDKSIFTPQEQKRIIRLCTYYNYWRDTNIEIEQILCFPQLSYCPIPRRILSIFAGNKDNTIDICELLAVIGRLYSNSEEFRLQFLFKFYDLDEDDYISNGDLFQMLKMMIGYQLSSAQLQQIVDRTIIKADTDFDGKISFHEFKKVIKDRDVFGRVFQISNQERKS